jgi:DNA polymerase III delta subunit
MPRFEPKQIQQDLAAKKIWPLLWLVGTETMKARELARRVRAAASGEGKASLMQEVVLDGETCSAADILDAAQTLRLGSLFSIVSVKRAEKIKDPELLIPLAEKPSDAPPWLVLLFAAALDGRKKSTKAIVQSCAVVNCEAVAEQDRPAWVTYLAKTRGLKLDTVSSRNLAALDPWTLDRVDMELSRLALLPGHEDATQASVRGDANRLCQSLMAGDRAAAEREIAVMDTSVDGTLQTLGLLAWHLRQMATKPTQRWTTQALMAAEQELQEFDRAIKQTTKLPRALWSTLAERLTTISQRS